MVQWIADWYAVVDQMNMEDLAKHTNKDIRLTFGNNPTSVGIDAMAAGLAPLWGSLNSMTHHIVRTWENPQGDYGVIEASISYVRKDDKAVVIPSCSTLHRDSDGLVDELNVYIDLSPLFA